MAKTSTVKKKSRRVSRSREVPRDFGWRFVLWAAWTNAITILATFQGVVAALMVDKEIFTHDTFRYLVIGNAVLTATIAQIKANKPPGPPPLKRRR